MSNLANEYEGYQIPSKALLAAHDAIENRMRSRTYDKHAYNNEVFLEGVADIAYAALEAAAPHLVAAAEARGRKQAADDIAFLRQLIAEVREDHSPLSDGSCDSDGFPYPCATARLLSAADARTYAAGQDTADG